MYSGSTQYMIRKWYILILEWKCIIFQNWENAENSEIKPRVVLCQVTLHGLFALRSIASKTAGALSEPEGHILAIHIPICDDLETVVQLAVWRNESLFWCDRYSSVTYPRILLQKSMILWPYYRDCVVCQYSSPR